MEMKNIREDIVSSEHLSY